MTGFQLQWNLDRTVDRSIGVAVDLIRVAHSDNVQLIALMACESFGATLPICRQTRSLIENDCKSEAEPTVLRLIKAIIVTSGGQTLYRLASNLAGLNFLALAASLVSVTSNADSAAAIHRMIEETAADKLLVPPEYHVRSILDVLEPRLNRSGFSDRCYTTEVWLRSVMDNYAGDGNEIPSTTGIGSIVSVLRNLARLGDEKVDRVILTPNSCFAWLITFIEWCLGVSPALQMSSGTIIRPEPESKVIIVFPALTKPSEGVTIETFTVSGSLYDTIRIHHAVDDLGNVITFTGMVNLRTHAEQTLQSLEADNGLGLRAVMESLSYAIPEVAKLLILGLNGLKSGSTRILPPTFPRLFPEETRIQKTIEAYFGPYAAHFHGFQKLPPGSYSKITSRLQAVTLACNYANFSVSAFDLPVLRQWAKEDFFQIEEGAENEHMSSGLGDPPPITRASRSVSLLIAHILSLSLLNTDLASVRLRFSRNWISNHGTDGRLCSHLFNALRHHEWKYYKWSDVLVHMLDILGHINPPKPTSDWLGSSRRGQVVLPSLLLDPELENAPCYRFICLPGVLTVQDRPKGEIFEAITPAAGTVIDHEPIPVPSAQIKALTRFAALEHEWICRILPGSLQVSLGLKDHTQSYGRSNLQAVVQACGHVIFIPPCGHAQNQVKAERIEDYIFIQPSDFLKGPGNASDKRKIKVYAVRGNDPLRLMVIGALRNKLELIGFSRYACFQCSLKTCRKEGANFLVC